MPSRKTSTSVGKRKMSAASHTAAVDNHPASNNANSPVHKLRAKKRSTSRKGKSVTSHRHRNKQAASRSKTASKRTPKSHSTSAKGRRHSTADRKKKAASRRRHAKK